MATELTDTTMTDRQRTYREIYRSRVVGWYNGWLHVALIYTIGIAAMTIYIESMSNIQWYEWLIVPAVFFGANFFEWFLHRYIMHRPSNFAPFRAIYQRHTLMHHQFFTDEEMRFAGSHDFRVTFFPPYALVTFLCMSIPMALMAGWLFGPNVGWLLISSTTVMYLLYEFMHACCHIDENWFVRNVPFINTIRRHHTAHHNQSIMMERNMNLTFPIMDWLFGTSDLNRGLLGHLFNGYDTRFVKTDMRKTSRTPDGRPTRSLVATPAE